MNPIYKSGSYFQLTPNLGIYMFSSQTIYGYSKLNYLMHIMNIIIMISMKHSLSHVQKIICIVSLSPQLTYFQLVVRGKYPLEGFTLSTFSI